MMEDENGKKYEIEPDSYNSEGESIYHWNGDTFKSVKIDYYPKGRIVYYGHLYSGVCD